MTANHSQASLVVSNDEALIGLLLTEDGREVVRYFASAEEADRAVASSARQDAVDLAGAWKDLDWETMQSELDRIRHETPPSAPLTL